MKEATRKIEEKIKAVKGLQESEGWNILREVMEQEVLNAAFHLSEQRDLSLEEIHYRRGSMWAARKLLDVPTALIMKLENELMMEAAQQSADSLK